MIMKRKNIRTKEKGQQPVPKKNYNERYASIATSDWFLKAYKNKSLGDVLIKF